MMVRSRMFQPLSDTLTPAFIAVFAYSFVVIGFAKFIHHRLSDNDIKQAQALADECREHRDTWRTFNPVQRTHVQLPWYTKVQYSISSNARYRGVGALFFIQRSQEPNAPHPYKHPSSCTAFYVAPDIIATAAHCMKMHGITATSGHIILFRQMCFDTPSRSKTDQKAADRLITEWIYPGELQYAKTEDFGAAWGFDVAFMRTHASGSQGYVTYSLGDPGEFLKPAGKHPLMKVAGYPREYAEFLQPVFVICELAKADDELVKQDKGIQRTLRKTPKGLEESKDNQLVCVGKTGNMAAGGSGSPWFLDETEISATDKEKETKLRTVYGISAWALRPNYDESKAKVTEEVFKEEQTYCRAMGTAWIQKRTLDIYTAIKETPKDKTFLQAVEGKF